MAFTIPNDPTEKRKLLHDLFDNPNLLPPTLLSFLNDYNALNQPPVPASNIMGISGFVELLDTNMNTVTVANTITETSIYSFTVPANLLQSSGGIRVDLSGQLLNNSGAGRTIQVKVKYGSTTMWADVSDSIGVGTAARGFSLWLILGANASTSAQKLTGAIYVGDKTAPTTGVGELGGVGSAFPLVGTGAENSKTKLTFDILVKFAAADANLVFTKHFAYTTRIAH